MDTTGYNSISFREKNTSNLGIMPRNNQQRPASTYSLKKNKYSTSNFQAPQKKASNSTYMPPQRARSAKNNINAQQFYLNKNTFASNKNLLVNNFTKTKSHKVSGYESVMNEFKPQNSTFRTKERPSIVGETKNERPQSNYWNDSTTVGSKKLMPSMISLQENHNRMNPRNDWVEGDKKILFDETTGIKNEINQFTRDNKLAGSYILQQKGMMKRYERMILVVSNMEQGEITEETLATIK